MRYTFTEGSKVTKLQRVVSNRSALEKQSGELVMNLYIVLRGGILNGLYTRAEPQRKGVRAQARGSWYEQSFTDTRQHFTFFKLASIKTPQVCVQKCTVQIIVLLNMLFLVSMISSYDTILTEIQGLHDQNLSAGVK